MDLEGVKRKLTEGYERINKMKVSTSKIETCRARLKARGDQALDEVKATMSNIAQKLYQLQQSIESTIKQTVTERENQLDVKKKEIHNCYANLVKVCVEADKVLRGRNVDLLGRSCQRLFCKFEAANIKLDAAEKVDTDGLIGFEFQDNSKQFLSSAYVARLQHFNRYGRLAEIDEFWVNYQNTDDLLDRTNETTYMITTPDRTECSSIRPATVRRSTKNISPKQSLETIQEVPEDSSPVKSERANVRSRPWSVPVVHIREEDLSAGTCHLHNCYSCIDSFSQPSKFISPPPGFPRLPESCLEMNSDIQRCAQLQKQLCIATDPRSSKNPEVYRPVCFANGHLEGETQGKRSTKNGNFAHQGQNESLSHAAYRSVRSCPASPQDTEISPKMKDRARSERYRDVEDFVWDSDDSSDAIRHPGSCSIVEYQNGTGGSLLKNGPTLNFPSQASLAALKSETQKKTTTSEASGRNEKAGQSIMSFVSINGQQSVEKRGDARKENHHGGEEQSGYCLEPEQAKTIPDVTLTNVTIKQEMAEPEDVTLTNVTIKQEMAEPEDQIEKEPMVEIKQEKVSPKRKEVPDPVRKPTVRPVNGTELERERVSARNLEVSRPVKIKSKRLDLSHMLLHIGGGVFVIQAKCIEKIRGDFDHPIGVCTNSKGDVIVADTSNHIVKVCNNGRVINRFGGDLKMRRPSAVVVNEKDEIFVKDDNCLYHFDADGKFIKTMGKRMMNAPYGLGMTKEGDLVVVDALYSNGRMHVFQQDGAMDTFPYQPLRSQHEDSKCRFLAVHGQEVLTSDLGRSCLYVTNQRGELSKVLGRRGKRCGELNEPAGVAVDSVGNWVVADSKNHRVQVFAENGYFMAMLSFTGEAIRRPSGIHLTSDGLLYVINYLDSVIKVFKLGAS